MPQIEELTEAILERWGGEGGTVRLPFVVVRRNHCCDQRFILFWQGMPVELINAQKHLGNRDTV